MLLSDFYDNSDNEIKHSHSEQDTRCIHQHIGQLTASSIDKKLMKFVSSGIKDTEQEREKKIPYFFTERECKRTKQNAERRKLRQMSRLSDNKLK